MYSVFGEEWKPFSLKDPEMFTLNSIDTERTSLNMANGERFFEQWSGTLIRLSMKCNSEEHCVVLKIEGSRENKTQNVSSPTTSALNSTTTSDNSTSSPDGSQMSSMFFIVPVVVFFCLLIVALVIIVYYRRRGKRLNSEEDHRPYEDSSAKPFACYEDPALFTAEMQGLTPYDSPGITICSGNHYERPKDGPDQPISRQNGKDSKEFQYDYATREETSQLPHILNGDITLADETSGAAKPRREQNSDSLQPSEKREQRIVKTPIYQTLEEDSPENDSNKSAYEEPHKNPNSRASDKPVYYTLEEDSPAVDDIISAYATPHENKDSSTSSKPIYHTLEEHTP
ncbi:uncharacterized protein LOC114533463 [Dendronephthya gigantea]|uniref:uncharacterized protein LOC114533463 n=1 Tax=Dendronephthya gigantea TaxID=151771 RepID=UPI00106CA8C6|nr:uncharacterized protein LOC114533463 [Dendronephthya gigantea]